MFSSFSSPWQREQVLKALVSEAAAKAQRLERGAKAARRRPRQDKAAHRQRAQRAALWGGVCDKGL